MCQCDWSSSSSSARRLCLLIYVLPSLHSHKTPVYLPELTTFQFLHTGGCHSPGTSTRYLDKPRTSQHFRAQHNGVLSPTHTARRLPVFQPDQKALSALPTLLIFCFPFIS